MKFNPIVLLGLALGIGGAIWGWVEQENHSAPDALPIAELGIVLLFVGHLFDGLFKKK